MGTGQMVLVVGAIFLLGMIILSANGTFRENERVVTDSEFGIAAVSLATSLIEEAEGKDFDEACTDSGITNITQLTPPGSFGPSSTERYHPADTSHTDFDDLSDFNGFTIEYVHDTLQPMVAQYRGDASGFRADYFLSARVQYVNAGGGVAFLDDSTGARTWHKKFTVTVTSPSSTDTLSLSTVISYWK